MYQHLFTPLRLGDLQLEHRLILAPLTRMRADRDGLFPRDGLADEYYTQRATKGGLLISEATLISTEALIDHGVPGIFTEKQTAQWKNIVDSVHAKGALFSCQLWHTGRVAHHSFKKHPLVDSEHIPGVSASNVRAPGKTRSTFTGEKTDYSTPRPLRKDEIPRLLNDYRRAAENCKKAGFDAIEIHSAHGYLLDQFLNDGTNKREDEFGPQTFDNRARLLIEVLETVSEVYPFSRIGVRLSPHHVSSMKYYGTDDSDPDRLYAEVIKRLGKFNLAYLLLTEPRWFGGKFDQDHTRDPGFSIPLANPAKFRKIYKGKVIGAGGFTPITANKAIQDGDYDGIAMGRWWIANPDFVKRIRKGLPLNKYNRKLFYAAGPEGYIDYPSFDEVQDKSTLVPHDRIGQSLSSSKL